MAAAVFMTLFAAFTAEAAQPASLFKGGSYDGYSRQTATAATLPASPEDWMFMGGRYDGYSQLALGGAAIPPGPVRGTVILLH
jgi:hypothetical protein